jgi:hypothetical protein
MNLEPFAIALRARFGCDFFDEDGVLSTSLVGTHSRIRIDTKRDVVLMSTPVENAHDGLPAAILLKLLQWNFPNPYCGGAFLRPAPIAGYVELASVVPAGAIAPDDAVTLMDDQIIAAARLNDWILDALQEQAAA